MVLYEVAAGVMVWLCFAEAGPLAPAIIAYAAVIICMAVLATGLGVVGTLGGISFLISDSLIAIRSFAGLELPQYSFLLCSLTLWRRYY